MDATLDATLDTLVWSGLEGCSLELWTRIYKSRGWWGGAPSASVGWVMPLVWGTNRSPCWGW